MARTIRGRVRRRYGGGTRIAHSQSQPTNESSRKGDELVLQSRPPIERALNTEEFTLPSPPHNERALLNEPEVNSDDSTQPGDVVFETEFPEPGEKTVEVTKMWAWTCKVDEF